MKASLLMESYLLYSSLTLFTMGCLALALSIFFRSKLKALNGLPKNLSANVFNKTFIVFDPYPEQKKMIRSFLSAFPIVLGFASLGLALALMLIFEAGFMLSFFVTIIGLNLMVLEDAREAYQNSKTFVNAVQGESSLGTGDLRVFQVIKRFMPRLSNYYLGLSIVFMAFSAALPYVWSSMLWLSIEFMRLIFQASGSTRAIGWVVTVFLFALAVVFVQTLASAIKSKLLRHATESSSSTE